MPFAQVQSIVAERCASCHSLSPTQEGFSSAPLGIKLDTPDEIVAQAEVIKRQAVAGRAMPLGNMTKMTQAERDLLGRWIDGGAQAK